MDFEELRNSVEHIASVVERDYKGESVLDSAIGEALGVAVLVFGQTLVGIFERLDSIAKSLEKMANPPREFKQQDVADLPATFRGDS